MPILLWPAMFIGCSVALTWLSVWTAHAKRRVVKWAGAGLAGFGAAAFGLVGLVALLGIDRLHARRAPVPDIKVAGTPEQIQRGHGIAAAYCDACHSSTGTLTGGRNLGEHLPLPLGRFISANLTPAGQLSRWSDGQIFRAIRNGIDADGRWLIIMSLTNAGRLSDADIQALIAYIRSVPAAGAPTPDPPDRLSPLGLGMVGAGLIPDIKPVINGAIIAPPKAGTVAYGEYILSYHDCRQCHGANLMGGVAGQFGPIGPGLTLVKDWSRDEFIATLRTGIDPLGHHLDRNRMPWPAIGKMDDDELGAIYAYLAHLPDNPDGS
ncbi:MAG TPA: c-type cytochrome [Bradyrhizobium sp.]|nr:c-type cytochrome [Bradyrhizobium sp.]